MGAGSRQLLHETAGSTLKVISLATETSNALRKASYPALPTFTAPAATHVHGRWQQAAAFEAVHSAACCMPIQQP
jgi:hypothetical protein